MKNQNVLQVHPVMCQQQCEDLDTVLKAIDDFGANTLALANQGPQGYMQFIEARDNLRQFIKETTLNYRFVKD